MRHRQDIFRSTRSPGSEHIFFYCIARKVKQNLRNRAGDLLGIVQDCDSCLGVCFGESRLEARKWPPRTKSIAEGPRWNNESAITPSKCLAIYTCERQPAPVSHRSPRFQDIMPRWTPRHLRPCLSREIHDIVVGLLSSTSVIPHAVAETSSRQPQPMRIPLRRHVEIRHLKTPLNGVDQPA